MEIWRGIFTVAISVLLLIIIVSSTTVSTDDEGTLCYFCVETKANGSCQTDVSNMADAAGKYLGRNTGYEGATNKYVKNCTAYPNKTYCMVEWIRTRGQSPSYIRDCSDGYTFSYDLPKLHEASAGDNQTVCAYQTQGHVVCVRLCRGPFCNGPQPSSKASITSEMNFLQFLLLLCFNLCVLVNF